MPPNRTNARSATVAEEAKDLLTPIRDLGRIFGPLIAFGGPLGNLDALEALFVEADRLGIPHNNMICSGDIAAYCAEPEPCIRYLRETGAHVLMGNCEESLAMDAEDCGCNFIEGSTCASLADQWYQYSRAKTSDESRSWMGTLPRRMTFTMGGARFTVIHGGARRINRYLFASNRKDLFEEYEALAGDVVIGGHSGLPFTTDLGAGLWHNSGALGLPANDGTPRVWYSVISFTGEELVFDHRPLEYDYQGQAGKMRAAGLPEAYA